METKTLIELAHDTQSPRGSIIHHAIKLYLKSASSSNPYNILGNAQMSQGFINLSDTRPLKCF